MINSNYYVIESMKKIRVSDAFMNLPEPYIATFDTFFNLAIKALDRDAKVDYITDHWNDVRHNFVAACEAFEDILKVYGRGISEDVENENRN